MVVNSNVAKEMMSVGDIQRLLDLDAVLSLFGDCQRGRGSIGGNEWSRMGKKPDFYHSLWQLPYESSLHLVNRRNLSKLVTASLSRKQRQQGPFGAI